MRVFVIPRHSEVDRSVIERFKSSSGLPRALGVNHLLAPIQNYRFGRRMIKDLQVSYTLLILGL